MRYNPILKPCKVLQQHHALPLGERVFNRGGAGADPGFFLGGVALVSCSTTTPVILI